MTPAQYDRLFAMCIGVVIWNVQEIERDPIERRRIAKRWAATLVNLINDPIGAPHD